MLSLAGAHVLARQPEAPASPVGTVGTWWSPLLFNAWDTCGLVLTSWDDDKTQRSTFFPWMVRSPAREGSANYFWSCHVAFSKTRIKDHLDLPWLGFWEVSHTLP